MNDLIKKTLLANSSTMTCVAEEDIKGLHELLVQEGYSVCLANLTGANEEIEMYSRIVESLPSCSSFIERHKSINMAALEEILVDRLLKEKK